MTNSRNRLRRAALLLALLVLAAIVTGVAASAATTVIPKQLTGTWSRLGPPGADQITVSPRGKVTTPLGTLYDTFSRVTAHRLSISGPASGAGRGPCSGTGRYRWKVAKIPYGDIYKPGHQLTLTKIHDACKPRVGLFSGRWSN
jgi:hypothetical protein